MRLCYNKATGRNKNLMAQRQKNSTQANAFLLDAALGEALTQWYTQNARALPWRRDRNPYHVWLSEIMLQQTRTEAVKPYYERFLARLSDVFALARCSDEELMKLWEGLGYYSRARRLKETACAVVEKYGGRFPASYEELLCLPGIGPYTAGAIASICFNLPTPAVDGNVLRVIARVHGIFESVDEPSVKKRVEDALRRIYPTVDAGDFTQSIMELGATVCLPNGRPKCELCPVAPLCAALKNNAVSTLPVRTPKKKKLEEMRTVFLLRCGGQTAILKRAETGLLGGLWELPNVLGELDAQQALDAAAAWGMFPVSLTGTLRRTHIFTHIVWRMTCHIIECSRTDARFVWADKSELSSRYALPSAFRQFL